GCSGVAVDSADVEPRASLGAAAIRSGVTRPAEEGLIAETLQRVIAQRYRLHRHLADKPIHIVVVGDTVLLLGVVPSDIEKNLAGRFAVDTVGIASVDNQISIIPSEQSAPIVVEARSDEAVARDAETAIQLSRSLADVGITVGVRRGIARLKGVVETEGQRVYVEEIVGGVPGIRWVRNGLLVQTEPAEEE
ncbi:MAG: hypothetical protein RL417_1640, partial [Pseudomonadota bacterium]